MSSTITTFPNDQPRVADLTETEQHGLLSAERRRLVLTILTEQTTPIELADLAAEIAAQKESDDATSEETLNRIQVTLHHTHLPKMDDLGVIDYDANSRRVTR